MTSHTPEPTTQPVFMLLGVSHHRAGVAVRERFSLNVAQQKQLLHEMRQMGATCCLVIGTCNRTELFAKHTHPDDLLDAFLRLTGNTREDFEEYGHSLFCRPALERLFHIGCGLDSQILGDLQVVKQVKEAYEHTCTHQLADSTLHRLMQHVIRAHKRVRTETSLGKGAASIAGAAVQFILQQSPDLSQKRILLIGTGKMGKITCKNLLSHEPAGITLMNRTQERAERMGRNLNVRVAPMEHLAQEIAAHDIVVVATGAQLPVVHPVHVQCPVIGHKVLIDLSVPRNISPEVANVANVTLADLDALQAATDTAYQERLDSIPAAKALVQHEMENFEHWLATQKVAPTIQALNLKLEQIRRQELATFRHRLAPEDLETVEHLTERIVKKIAALSIDHLRNHAEEGEQLSDLVREMFQLHLPEPGAAHTPQPVH